jgi:cysteine desulfurase
MLVNNETGAIQPVAEAAALCRAHGALLHCDAVQALGRLPIDMGALGADMLTLSAHKAGGPQGVGALVLGPGVAPPPLLAGGGQERGRRPGTHNVAGIAGFAAAVEAATSEDTADLAGWRDALEERVRGETNAIRVIGGDAPRVAGVSCLACPGFAAETQVIALDLAGVSVSAGAACSSGKVAPSHVLRAMGLGDDVAGCAIRVSAGWASRAADFSAFAEAYLAMLRRSSRAA